jgi:hypothetical protein
MNQFWGTSETIACPCWYKIEWHPHLTCIRGTLALEGLHQKLRQLVRGFSNSPRFTRALLCEFLHRWNHDLDRVVTAAADRVLEMELEISEHDKMNDESVNTSNSLTISSLPASAEWLGRFQQGQDRPVGKVRVGMNASYLAMQPSRYPEPRSMSPSQGTSTRTPDSSR